MVQNLIIDSRTDGDNGIFIICINTEIIGWCRQGKEDCTSLGLSLRFYLCAVYSKRDTFEIIIRKFRFARYVKSEQPLIQS